MRVLRYQLALLPLLHMVLGGGSAESGEGCPEMVPLEPYKYCVGKQPYFAENDVDFTLTSDLQACKPGRLRP